MAKWRYFLEKEVEGLEPEFVSLLDMARHQAGIPFLITSGKRSTDQNERAMGVDGSAHIKGLAVDIRCNNSGDRYKMLKALLGVGIKRIGVYNAHLHCDMDPEKPQEVIWTGNSH